MKKFHFGLIFIIVLTISVILPSKSFAVSNWVLYDNFNSGSFDTRLWAVEDGGTLAITIEEGRAKFVHDVSKPAGTSYSLVFKKRSRKIEAIKVNVWVEKDPGEGRTWARIGGYQGEDEDGNRIWSQIYIPPQEEGVQCRASAQTNPGNQFVYELFMGHFKNPIEIIDKKFTLILKFNLSQLEYEGSGLGIIRHKLKNKLKPTVDTRKVIGTRNNEAASGDFIVYFDNVYVIYSE